MPGLVGNHGFGKECVATPGLGGHGACWRFSQHGLRVTHRFLDINWRSDKRPVNSRAVDTCVHMALMIWLDHT